MAALGSITLDCPSCGRQFDVPMTSTIDRRFSSPGGHVSITVTPNDAALRLHVIACRENG